jgi:hypothetical protein
MEFGDDGWDHPGIGVWPQRWREEYERTESNGEVFGFVAGRDGDSYWRDHGDGVKVSDARNIKTSLVTGWVPGTLWVRAPARRDLVDVSEAVLGRAAARVRIIPERSGWAAGPFYAGDEHEIAVDLATGLTLAITSTVDGAVFHRDEVTEFETNPTIASALTATPADAAPVPASQHFESVEEVAAATPLSLLAPRWLPPEDTFQSGGVYLRDGVPEAMLVFSRDRRAFISLYEWPESQAQTLDDEVYEWDHVERESRTVFISDQGDQPGQRVAHTTLDGTWVTIDAPLTGSELLASPSASKRSAHSRTRT